MSPAGRIVFFLLVLSPFFCSFLPFRCFLSPLFSFRCRREGCGAPLSFERLLRARQALTEEDPRAVRFVFVFRLVLPLLLFSPGPLGLLSGVLVRA